MNLIFRMFLTIFFANRASTLGPLDKSHKAMRVLPNDLDVQMHMNNGRYLSIMDLGRIDLMVRTGFWTIARKSGWFPVVGSVRVDYRRQLTVFQRYDMTSQIVGWDDRWIFLEQQFLVGEKIHARAIFKTMIRSKAGLVTPADVMKATGVDIASPELTTEMLGLG
jgi:acyl-CoA thioesterase FadM